MKEREEIESEIRNEIREKRMCNGTQTELYINHFICQYLDVQITNSYFNLIEMKGQFNGSKNF